MNQGTNPTGVTISQSQQQQRVPSLSITTNAPLQNITLKTNSNTNQTTTVPSQQTTAQSALPPTAGQNSQQSAPVSSQKPPPPIQQQQQPGPPQIPAPQPSPSIISRNVNNVPLPNPSPNTPAPKIDTNSLLQMNLMTQTAQQQSDAMNPSIAQQIGNSANVLGNSSNNSANNNSIINPINSNNTLGNLSSILNQSQSSTINQQQVPCSISSSQSSQQQQQQPNSMMTSLPSGNSSILQSAAGSNGLGMKNMGGLPHAMNVFDPIAQSLATFEQSMKNDEMGGINHLNLMSDMLMNKTDSTAADHLMQQSVMMALSNSFQQNNHLSGLHGHNNGFNMEMSELLASSGNGMMMPGMSLVGNHMTSIFDPISPNVGGVSVSNNNVGGRNSSNNSGHSMNQNIPTPLSLQMKVAQQHQQQQIHHPKKEEKFMLTPKPIEDLLMNPNEKKMTPPDPKSNTFAQAFKAPSSHEQNLKNASSWSSLGTATSPQNTSTSQSILSAAACSSIPSHSSKPKPAMDSFQQFKKAKEKLDRMKMLEQQQISRSQKEAAEKRQQEEKQKRQEEIMNGR